MFNIDNKYAKGEEMLKKRRKVAWLLVVIMLLSLANPYAISVHAEENNTIVQDDTTGENIDASATTTEEVTEEVTTDEVKESITELEPVTEESTEPDGNETTEITEPTAEETVSEMNVTLGDNTALVLPPENNENFERTPVFIEEEPQLETASSDSYTIFSDGTWSDGIIWYVKDNGKKHYVFCLDKGETMYSGKYAGDLLSGYSGKTAFRIAVALNYFKTVNGGYAGKTDYGIVQQAIWNEGDTFLMNYINHAWKLADNNTKRSSGSSSYDSRLTVVGSALSNTTIAGLNPIKVSNSGQAGMVSTTLSLSGTAWKYFANGAIQTNSEVSGKSSLIKVQGLYDKDGVDISADMNKNYVDTSGKLHIEFASGTANYGTEENPVTALIQVNFPYQGADYLQYLQTASGVQNVSYSAPANTSACFAIKLYTRTSEEKARVYINKVDEFGAQVTGCKFQIVGTSGDALTNNYYDDMIVDSSDDCFVIELAGEYEITEIAVPNNEWQLSPEKFSFIADWIDGKLMIKGDTLVGTTDSLSFTFTCNNIYNDGDAKLVKYGSVLTKYENGQFLYEKRKLNGVEFAFYAAEDIYCGNTLIFAKGTQITNEYGWGKYNDFGGIFQYYNHEVLISNNGLTDANGEILIENLPEGNYYAIETKPLSGFAPKAQRYSFSITAGEVTPINGDVGIINDQSPATCHVVKVDRDTQTPLGGGEFSIYANVSNTNYDGTPLFTKKDTSPAVVKRDLFTGKEIIEENKWVLIDSVVTDADGTAEFSNLPTGEYLVVETKAPEGYLLAEESFQFTHVYDKVATNGYHFEHTFEDIQGRTYSIVKHAEVCNVVNSDIANIDAYVYENKPVAGVTFGIYAAEDIYNTVNEKILSAGEQLGTCVTDANGVATYSNVLFNGKYYFKELQTADDNKYILDSTEYSFTVNADMNSQLNETPIINKQYKGNIKIIKTDGITTYPLSGVSFHLLDANKKVLGTYITDANGEIHMNNLPVGDYYVQEAEALKGYKLDDTLHEIHITKDNLNHELNIVNEHNETKITIKTDSTYSGSGQVRTSDMSPIGLIFGLFMLSSAGFSILAGTRRKKLQPLSVRGKKIMFIAVLSIGTLFLGGLTVKAASELKELSSKELKDTEYNGTIYKYALQKEYETSNKDEEIIFDEELDGMKLADVQYEVVDTILQKKTLEETKDYKELIVKDDSKVAKTITVDGNVYELQNITWSDVPNIETVSYTVDYGYQTAEPTPATTYEYTYRSDVMKKDNTVTLPFVRMEKGSDSWVDGFTATVTFHNLDGKYFNLGGKEITYNPNKLSLGKNEYKALVKMLGYDTSKYRLNSIAWSGGEYEKGGQTCRDAKATGQQYASAYKAYYEDDVENGQIYTAHATYTCEVDVPEEEAAPTYVMKATAYYEKSGISPVVMTVGIVILVILVVGILYVFTRKKKNVSSDPFYTEVQE